MDFVTSALILSWIAILLLALVVSGLIRQVHQLSRDKRPAARVGVSTGTVASDAGELLGGSRGVLLFLSPHCSVCSDVLEEAGQWITAGDNPPNIQAVYAADAAEHPVVTTVANRDDLFKRYDVVVTPFAVVVDDAAVVTRSEPIGSTTALRQLLNTTVSRPRSSS